MAAAVRYAARSNIGLVRSSNQDSGYAGPHLLVVADGMGGHAGGDIASSIAIGALVRLDDDALGVDALTELQRALKDANTEIREMIEENPELAGMGTTVTAFLRTGRRLALAHIGDSRAYLLRGGQLTQLTHDHTFVQTLVDDGRITEDEAGVHPQRSVVTRVLTGAPDDEPDVSWREMHHGDRYLLCSDGLCGFVAKETMHDILDEEPSVEEAADRLVDLALRAGGQDNITAIVVDVVRLSGELPPSVRPQVVGAAALHRPAAQGAEPPQPRTPAEKAAALTRSTQPAADPDRSDEMRLAEEQPRTRRGRLGLILGLTAALLAVLVGFGYGGYRWAYAQTFIGNDNGKVAIYHGLAEPLGPITLHRIAEGTDILVADLPTFYRDRVNGAIDATSMSEAQTVVADLRSRAQVCVTARSRGLACSADGTPVVPTTAATPSGTATTPAPGASTPAATTPATTPSTATTAATSAGAVR